MQDLESLFSKFSGGGPHTPLPHQEGVIYPSPPFLLLCDSPVPSAADNKFMGGARKNSNLEELWATMVCKLVSTTHTKNRCILNDHKKFAKH
jgi:hypothetical protein